MRVDWLILLSPLCGFACGSKPSVKTGGEALPGFTSRLIPEQLFSGFDAQHSFQLVAAAQLPQPLSPAVSWSSADERIATIRPLELKTADASPHISYGLISVQGAGVSEIRFSDGDQVLRAPLTVYAYDAAQIEVGRARYYASEGSGSERSCASCHVGSSGVDHSPWVIGAYSDREIIDVLETGFTPQQLPIEVDPPHRFNFATEAQRDGVVAYLRTLPINGVAAK